MSFLKYRPEIDGLRAIAVLSVIVYHAGFSLYDIRILSGGFIGVDIFFVLSGYLITSILLKEMAAGNFSILKFYERRARRILPALFLVMTASIPVALFWLLPKPFEEFTESLMAALFFWSNIFFWQQDSYTSVASALKPFLHTWSLAVEEQFYLFFPPLLLLLFRKFQSKIMAVFVVSFAFSLAGAQWASIHHPDAAFYLLPTRMWELLGGAILARLSFEGKSPVPSSATRLLPILGFLMIFYALLFYTDKMPHPGLLTFLPVAGTMLVIRYATPVLNVGKFLAWRPVVFVGLVSYSFYLWHQPVFAFARIKSSVELNDPMKWGLIALSFLLAVISWKFIEQPFRDRNIIPARKLWWSLGVAASILVACCILQDEFKIKENYFPEKGLTAEAVSMWDLHKILDETRCMKKQDHPYCIRGDLKGTRWITLGDSHIQRVTGYLWARLKDTGVTMTSIELGGCGYAPGMEVILNGKPDICTFEINKDREDFLATQPPGIILVMARYPLYIEGEGFDNGEGGIEKNDLMMRPNGQNISEAERKTAVKKAITESYTKLLKAGHKLILVYPVPEAGWDVAGIIKGLTSDMSEEEISEWIKTDRLSTSYDRFRDRTKNAYQAFDAVPDGKNVLRIYPEKIFCNQKVKGRCAVHDDKALFYADDDHLSKAGALILLDEILKGAEKKWDIKAGN